MSYGVTKSYLDLDIWLYMQYATKMKSLFPVIPCPTYKYWRHIGGCGCALGYHKEVS